MRYIILVLLFAACNSKPDVKTQFDNLEKVFEAGNWEMVDRDDTAYVFFSREGERFFNVYNYFIRDGDSVSTKVMTIQQVDGKIIWDKAELKTATDKGSEWLLNGRDIKFTKRYSLYIDVVSGTSKKFLKRTLPLSTFLIRKKYDFEHGTHTADAIIDTVRRRH